MSLLTGLQNTFHVGAIGGGTAPAPAPAQGAAPANGAAPAQGAAPAAPADGDKKADGDKQNLPDAGAGQAAAGAAAVQPPNTGKIVMGSVLRGAITGASMMFGANKFLPASWLTKIVHFIPFISKQVPMAAVTALAVGAVVGGVLGLVGGLQKSKKAAAEFAAAQAAQAQQPAAPVGDPVVVGPDGKPVPVDPATNMPAAPVPPNLASSAKAKAKAKKAAAKAKKNPIMKPGHDHGVVGPAGKKAKPAAKPATHGKVHKKRVHGGGGSDTHLITRGETLGQIAADYHTTVAAIQKANADKIKDVNLIITGDEIVIPA